MSAPVNKLPNPIRPAFTVPTDDGHVIVNIGPSHPATRALVGAIPVRHPREADARRMAAA